MSKLKFTYQSLVKLISMIMLVVFSVTNGLAQTAIIDAKFKTCLANNYPSLLDANQDLIIANAQAKTGTLKCVNLGMVDLKGLEYFTSISELNLDNNDIVDLSAISTLSQLNNISVLSNELEIVPDLSFFTSLKSFKANYNQLDNSPVFPVQIEEIQMGNNSLSGTLDFLLYTKLTNVVLFENDITALKGIENSIGLKHLNLSSNKLKTFQDLGSLFNLNHLSFENNQLSNVPKLNYSSLQYVGLGVNKLTFEDLMPFSTLNLSVDSFPKFGTQSKQEAASTLTKNEQGTWTWTLGFDQTLTNNVYHWYKNDEEINTSTTGELKLTNIALSDSGVYRCEVENTNPFFAGIKLLTESKTLKVNKGVVAPQCFKLTNVLENQIIKKCIHESRVTLKAVTTGLLNGELTYVLITNKDTLKSNSGEFEIKKEASYQLNVSDGVCVVAWTKTIDVAFDISNCEPLSFSPNGDGLEDEFYINQSGYAKVYDKKGKLVNEFAVPSYWDGRSKDGRLLDFGYYLVVINDQEKFGLSIMK